MVGRLLFENGIDFREFRVRFVVSSSETLLFVNSVLVNTSNRRADLKGREEPENEGVVQVLQQQLLSFTCASCPLSTTAFLASAFRAKNSVSPSPAASCFSLSI